MTFITADVAVMGSGFAGTLAALLLDRVGLRPVLIDRGAHPRFAIGESSTPVADLVLADISRRYGLPRLLPLARFGTWQAAYPELGCGRKRGFSYFRHEPDRPFTPRPDHETELLVAASSDDAHSDTHWLRADVDAFLVGEAIAAGVPYFDRTEVVSLRHEHGWRIAGRRNGGCIEVSAAFLIDATGEGQFLPRWLGLGSELEELQTHSRALYAHFRDVQPWREVLLALGGATADHPFCCDHAALHQVLDVGWMWQLRFENGTLSAGFALESRRRPLDETSPAEEWAALMARFPSLRSQFARSSVVAPESGLRRTGRLQRLSRTIAGEDWALLPHTAGFIDPLHSSGIAHSLAGVERLSRVLREHWKSPSLTGALRSYDATIRSEVQFIDELVAGCYASLDDFRCFAAYSMLYFAAATTYERRRQRTDGEYEGAFLCADDPSLRRVVLEMFEKVRAREPGGGEEAARFERELAAAIRPYNHVGLCDREARNMYRRTALPRSP